jgi:hypothetical protein
MIPRHRLSASTLLLLPSLICGCPARRGDHVTVPRQSPHDGETLISVSAIAQAPLTVAPPDAILLRLVLQPDPGSTGIVVPDVAELPSGDIIIAGTSWETDLGTGAERLADGFVAGYGQDGKRRWLCLTDTPPDDLRVDAAGGVHVALSRTGPAACSPAAGGPRAADRWGAPKGQAASSVVQVALNAHGIPRWSSPNSSVGVPVVLRSAVGDTGTVLLFGHGLAAGTFALSVLDESGRLRWSRRGRAVETPGPTDFPEFAVSSEGGVVAFTGVFTGTLDGIAGAASPLPSRSLVKLDARGRTVWSDPMTPADGGRDERLVVHAIAFDHDDILVLGHAARSMKLGGRLVSFAPGGSLFMARLDGAGRARWVRVFEQGPGLDPAEGARMLRAKEGTVIVVSKSFGPPMEDRDQDVEVRLMRLDREGRDASRRSLRLSGMPVPNFAASATGDSVLISAAVKSAAQQQSLFPGSSIPPATAGHTVLVGRMSME